MIHSTRFRNANDVKEFVDCLPRELGDRIYKLAGILTQFLHGQLPQPIDEPLQTLLPKTDRIGSTFS
eukprot:jgi/Hompol1/2593/HPOL_006091-RA